MIELNCESIDSTFESMSSIYGVSVDDIRSFLIQHPLAETGEPYKELFASFEKRFGSPRKVDRVYWFHLTRSSPEADFKSGILTLTEAWPILQKNLENILCEPIKRERLSQIMAGMKAEYHVPSRKNVCAILVKEAASRSEEMRTRDYLKIPDVIEAICNKYQNQYGEDIQNKVLKSFVPYIVKFWDDKWKSDYAKAALFYLRSILHGEDLSFDANRCFFSEWNIPKDRIVTVEKVHLHHIRKFSHTSRCPP